jgi:hypothetical protein
MDQEIRGPTPLRHPLMRSAVFRQSLEISCRPVSPRQLIRDLPVSDQGPVTTSSVTARCGTGSDGHPARGPLRPGGPGRPVRRQQGVRQRSPRNNTTSSARGPGRSRRAIRRALRARQRPVRRHMADQVNQLLVILYALLGLSIIIAILGIVNTLALSDSSWRRHQRQRARWGRRPSGSREAVTTHQPPRRVSSWSAGSREKRSWLKASAGCRACIC